MEIKYSFLKKVVVKSMNVNATVMITLISLNFSMLADDDFKNMLKHHHHSFGS